MMSNGNKKSVRLAVVDFDCRDNAKWVIYIKKSTSKKVKSIRLCTGIFNFKGNWCGIITITKYFKNYSDKVFDELSYRDWNIFRPSVCHKSIRDLIKQYNKQTFGFYNPTRYK